MPNRFRLKGASLEEIRRKAELQYGPAARIVSAEHVISPGIAGLFAGDRYEAIVEVLTGHEVITGEVVPDPDILEETDGAGGGAGQAGIGGKAAAPAAPAHHLQGSAIAALLHEADSAEQDLHRPGHPGVSTASPDFAELLEQLGSGLRAPAPAPAPVPAPTPAPAPGRSREPVPVPLAGVGDLLVLVGLGEDALDAALAMSTAAGGADVRTAGKLSAYGHLHVDGRQSATAARAHAVLTDQTVLVAYGLGKARDALARLQSVAAIPADQLWVVVDAGRKHEDTARWVGVLSAQLNVTAIAVVGAAETGTPETVNGLGLPVGWIDSGQSKAAGI